MTKITRLFDLLPYYEESFKPKDDVLAGKENGVWKKYSIKEFREIVDSLSYAFLKMGVVKGDVISSFSNNRPEYCFVDMAVMQVGAIHASVNQMNNSDSIKYIFSHSEPKYLFVSDEVSYQKIAPIIQSIPSIKCVYLFDHVEGVANWEELLTLGRKNKDEKLLSEVKNSIVTTDPVALIYTSGITGDQKGVLLSHRGLITCATGAASGFKPDEKGRALSFLPFSHVFEKAAVYYYLYLGFSVYCAESIQKFILNCRESKPTVMCCVPRIFDEIYSTAINRGNKSKGLKKWLFFWAMGIAEQYEPYGANGWWYQLKLSIAYALVLRKMRNYLGGNIKFLTSGGSALKGKVCRVMHASRLPVYEGYGLTETSSAIVLSSLPVNGVKLGTVGIAIPGVEVKISDNGEILTRGSNLMIGYYRDPELTASVIDNDGWFHTGDMGTMDDDGYVTVTGRMKDNFKTSSGLWIAPQPIESKIMESPYISFAVLLGENKNVLGALIVPDFTNVKAWCQQNGIVYTSDVQIIENEEVYEMIKDEVYKINHNLSMLERIKLICLVADNWSVATGELSMTLKVKRKFVLNKYADKIQLMFKE